MEEKDEGFTLIELLVVIIIIGILAAIAIPVFLNQRKKGYDAQTKSDVRNAITVFETYATDYNGAYDYAELSSATSLTGLTGMTIGKSANDTSLIGLVSSASNTATYKILGVSASGKEFCYNSANASSGVVASTATTGAITDCA